MIVADGESTVINNPIDIATTSATSQADCLLKTLMSYAWSIYFNPPPINAYVYSSARLWSMAFAVLLMNLTAPFIDQYTQPRTYGHARANRGMKGN